MTQLTKICQAAALTLALSASAQASQTFNFTFSDANAQFDGYSTVSGIVTLDGNGDGSFLASSVEITSLPTDMQADIPGGDLYFDYFSGYANTFVVSGGNITNASLVIYNNYEADAILIFNNYGITGRLSSPTYYLSDYTGDMETLSFSPTTAAVPEPSTWALFMAGAGLMGAAARRRRVAAKTA